MKKFYLIAALAISALTANAQSKLSLSTVSGTDLTNYAGKTLDVTCSRHVFTGWNTISLPFAVSEDQLNEVFGSDCKLESLAGVENSGSTLVLNFKDAKAEGIKANTPYILYYTGEPATKKIAANQVLVSDGNASVSYTVAGSGQTVTFATALKQTNSDGLYGILAKDNGEASFVNVDNVTNGFYATRCFVKVSDGNYSTLKTNHIGAGELNSISSVLGKNQTADVYNLTGVKVASNVSIDAINNLNSGIYVVNGKKFMVK